MAVDGRMPDSGLKPPPRFDLWNPKRQRRWTRNNTQAPKPKPKGNNQVYTPPNYNQPAPDFLANTPGYEATDKVLNDQLSASLTDINAQKMKIPGMLQQYMARSETDKGYANNRMDESLVGRGMYDSGVNQVVRNRDINTPFARERQDYQASIDQLLADLASAESGAYLTYNQGNADALVQRAEDASQLAPYSNQFPGTLPNFGESFGLGNTKGPRPRRKGHHGRNGRGNK